MPDADPIDPTLDRVWAVDVALTYTTYVVAEDADEAEQIARDVDDRPPGSSVRELTEPLDTPDADGQAIPHGRSCWEDRQLSVNEAVELIAGHKPVYDTQTLLMPFADSPPPLYPPRIEDYLAAGRCER